MWIKACYLPRGSVVNVVPLKTSSCIYMPASKVLCRLYKLVPFVHFIFGQRIKIFRCQRWKGFGRTKNNCRRSPSWPSLCSTQRSVFSSRNPPGLPCFNHSCHVFFPLVWCVPFCGWRWVCKRDVVKVCNCADALVEVTFGFCRCCRHCVFERAAAGTGQKKKFLFDLSKKTRGEFRLLFFFSNTP